jgi:hypothetical protein
MANQKKSLSRQPNRRTAIVAMLLCLVAVVLTVVAAQAEKPAPAEAVAREILEIQNELGGSIVSDLFQESPPAAAEAAQWCPAPPEAQRDATWHLRDTAWRLDASAHQLECLDLYGQADALRELATRLRQDARDIKRQSARAVKRQPASELKRQTASGLKRQPAKSE